MKSIGAERSFSISFSWNKSVLADVVAVLGGVGYFIISEGKERFFTYDDDCSS